jgi:hypothetical protein
MVRQGKEDGGVLSSTNIDAYLPNPLLIRGPAKTADMISITKRNTLNGREYS